MSGKTCRRVRFSPHITEMPKPPPLKTPPLPSGNWRRVAGMMWNARLPTSQPVRFLQRASDRVTRAIRQIFVRRKRVSPNSRSRPFVSPLQQQQHDSHRTEAIEDCIKFINSSCSFQRSNSVPTNLSYYY